jgi:membrane-associated protein
MSLFLTNLLAFFETYGYPALWITVFIAAIGAPLPVSLVLLAAGAFSALGDFNIFLLAIISVSAAVAGDNLGYLIGRRWGSALLKWFAQTRPGRRVFPPRSVERSRVYFNRHGGWAVFLSRFLVAALGGIINLLAGSELYSYRKFLACDFSGEVVGTVVPLTFGFIYGASWEAVGDILGTFSFLVLAILIAAILSVRLLRYLRAAKSTRVQLQESQKTELPNISGLASRVDPPATSSGPSRP